MGELSATTRKRAKAGRKRRVAGWALLVIGVLITGVWGASRWWTFGYSRSKWCIEMKAGIGYFLGLSDKEGFGPVLDIGAYSRSPDVYFGGWQWSLPHWEPASSSTTRLNLQVLEYQSGSAAPFSKRIVRFLPWPFALAALLGGGWLVWSGRRARRRAMTGLCRKCGYDLAGLAAGAPCPECGATMAAR